MNQQDDNKSASAKKMLDTYNLVVNLFWSALAFVPVIVFCNRFVSLDWWLVFLTPSLLSLLLPRQVFNKMQLSNSTAVYKKFSVGIVSRLSQNGTIVHRLVKKRFPKYKAVTHHRSSLNRLLQQTYLYEKFHFATGLFFALLIVFASFKNLFWWMAVLLLINIAYNVYPILFQQYVRLKLKSFTEKEKERKPTIERPASGRKLLHRFG